MNVAQNIWLLVHKLWGNYLENQQNNFSIPFSVRCYALVALHLTASQATIKLSIDEAYTKDSFTIYSENKLAGSYCMVIAVGK